ncbi:hypothetical protein AVEN_166139-1 [Araneus ventricosus]|uniref:Uncharacterized protein n=1 Tax=Araneus ventricosus TaxID=182803 RepID=A0A4Y2CJA5_ARAVE|nr:hypothetical protein AVEN_166139-1 [Araneus ventricosus]
MSGINVEEYLTADYFLMVFEGVTEEDNPFRLGFWTETTNEMENGDEEDDDTDTLLSLSTSLYRLQSGLAPVGVPGPLSGKSFVPLS